jgi:hypothetical protein
MNSTNDASTGAGAIGIGGPTSGEAGATLTHETMAETGGSGGDALTKPKDAEIKPSVPVAGDTAQADVPGSDAATIVRGHQDTRSSQAGPSATGLGMPETGANQTDSDLAPPR